MANKPTISYSCSENGDENLILTLSTHLRSLLLDYTVTWERSFGRSPRKIKLDAKLLPLTTALLKRNDLVTRPYFHIFWTNCNDSDYYRSTVKNEITDWLAEIGKHGSNDWMIILVSGEGVSRTSKPKLQLTRSSMTDKLKSDFSPKNPDRIQTLQDPLKDSTKSTESWAALCTKLVSFAVLCIEKVVSAYEERVRTERERRNELSWNFCSYFTLQEELAFMFEMLQLYDEALIQYDELDAMFTQYLINAQAGDIAHWLSNFSDPITQWHPLSLWRWMDGEARQNIVQCKATIIDIRNYLFSRHCHLLIKSGMLQKVTERMHVFLHSLETEIGILEIMMPQGAIECWLFMSCLELSQTLKRKCADLSSTSENEEVSVLPSMTYDQVALEMANLWDLARKKLYKLAVTCGLLPNEEPSSQQLNHVVDLIAGIGDDEDRGDKIKAPALILRECLSSKNNLYRQYLELCEQAIGIYKHTGRFRTARSIGGDLAQFYMLAGKPEKAESFLVDCVRMYTNDGWQMLVSSASQNLAECCKYLCKIRRYIRICCTLMCDRFLSHDRQKYYLQQVSSNSNDVGDVPLAIMLSVFAHVNYIKFSPAKTHYHVNDDQYIYISVTSIAPSDIKFQKLEISLRRIGNYDSHTNHHVTEMNLEELDEDMFLEVAEEEDKDPDILLTSFSKRGGDVVKKSPKKKRYISSCSFDNIASIHHTNKLNKDGMIELMSMDNSACQANESKIKHFPDVVNFSQECEVEIDETVLFSSIICRQSHQLLKRQDSYHSTHSIQFGATNIVMDSYEDKLEAVNVVLKPGENLIKVKVDTSSPGEFSLTQLRFAINNVYFVLPRILPNISYMVNKQLPRIETKLQSELNLTCGVYNEAEIILKNGDYPIVPDTGPIKISLNTQLNIENDFQCSILNKDDKQLTSNNLTAEIEGDKSFMSLKLPPCPVLSTITLKFMCKLDLPETDQPTEEVKHHKRSLSAPMIHKIDHIKERSENAPVPFRDDSSKKDFSVKSIKTLPSMLPTFEKESPVKKFLTFMREVAGDHKKDTSTVDLHIPEETDDLIEVTLDEVEAEHNVTFPRISTKTLLRPSFGFMGHRKTRSDVTAISFHKEPVQFISDESQSSKSQSATSSPSLKQKSPLLTLPRTPPIEKKQAEVVDVKAEENENIEEEDQSILHPISLKFPWDDVLPVKQNLKFNWPIKFEHKMINCHILGKSIANHRMLSVMITNICDHVLHFRKPSLKFLRIKHIFVKSFNDVDEVYDISKDETVYFTWKVTSGVELKPPSHLDVNTSFEMNSDNDDKWSMVRYNFQVPNIKTLYIISTQIGKGDKIVCGQTTSIEIIVERLRNDPDGQNEADKYQMLMFKVVDTRGHWAVCERSSGLISMPPAQSLDSDGEPVTSKTSIEIMPLVEGFLHRPHVQIFRYYKRNSSEYDEQLSSTDSPVLKPPRLKEFERGEVLNIDRAMQVRVLPASENVTENTFSNITKEPVPAY